MLSLILDPALEYPDSDEFYSPSEAYPEYSHGHIAEKKNSIYRAVRDCLAQAGLDRERLGTPEWNPLGEYVRPGSKVFVLCNFMSHREPAQSALDYSAECTHASVLRPLLDYLLLAAGPSGTVTFGNAPIQFCDWDLAQSQTGADVVSRFYDRAGAPVKAKDLRLFVAHFDRKRGMSKIERRPESDGVTVDLGGASMLVDLDRNPRVKYRVINYPASRTDGFHRGGRHAYVIHREILEADVLFNLCKLKTHEKVGVTCSLKGVVGTVGHKDSLPHHRFGPPEAGGDEYPNDPMRLLQIVSHMHERAQGTRPGTALGNGARVADRFVRSVAGKFSRRGEGAWWGNDTAWRMVLDLARIVTHADAGGNMHQSPVRRHIALIDGVVGGEGDGPYLPTAYRSGMLLFGDNSPAADHAATVFMGYEPDRVPLIREALRLSHYPLLVRPLGDEEIVLNGRGSSLEELKSMPRHHYLPPPGWVGRL